MSELPDDLVALLDGTEIDDKVGTTLLVTAVGEDGWPLVASLSVGEALAVSPRVLLLSLYDSSRTSRAIAATSRVLLLATSRGCIVRARLGAEQVEDAAAAAAGRRTFRCTVDAVEIDAVPYARVTHGIEFELLDDGASLERWRRQIDELRQLAQRIGSAS